MSDGTVFVRYIHGLPLAAKGITTPNPDGTFSVYINADLPDCIQKEVYDHELYHIEHDHLYNFDTVQANEAAAKALKETPQEEPESSPETSIQISKPKRKKKTPTPKYPTSPDELWEHNQKMLLRWEEKWLYDVG